MASISNSMRSALISKLLLATCLLGLAAATASASIVFQVNSTLNTGSQLTGTITVDNVGNTIINTNLALGQPTPDTCVGAPAGQFSIPGNPGTYVFFDLPCASGNILIVEFFTDAAGDLVGFQGGPIVSVQYGGGGTSTTGSVSQGGFFQVRYASNLINGGDAVIDITNTGASSTTLLTPGQIVGGVNQNNIDGSLCVNIYTFAADEQEVACCSCLVTPNALWSASVKTALLNSTLTPSFPNEVVVKLISSAPIVSSTGTQSCNPATILNTGALIEPGVMAWGTSLHGVPTATGPTFQMAETPFSPSTLSIAELTRDVQECQFIQILGSGQFGICKGCSNVGLGAAAQ